MPEEKRELIEERPGVYKLRGYRPTFKAIR